MLPSPTVVDYGLGNLYGLSRALQHVGAPSVDVTSDPARVRAAERLIIPGVGAFGDGMAGLRERGLLEPVKEAAASGRPVLGICLGMQLLMQEGNEFGAHEGLGVVPGRTVSFKRGPGSRLKVPHVGWNALRPGPGGWDGSIFAGLPDGAQVYFVHSYVAELADPALTLAAAEYGGQAFCAALRKDRVFGCQFHPEKSGPVGLKILANFLALGSGEKR